jgi:riboflavin transporter FmnP
MLIGAVYLAPVGYVVNRYIRVDNKLLAIILATAAASLLISLVAVDVLLPLTTVIFVLSATGASAITAARAIKYLLYRQ